MTTSDPRRSPPGTESAWAYTHVPQQIRGDAGGDGISDAWDDTSTKAFVDRMERRIEQLAPGFQSLLKARHVKTPPHHHVADRNLPAGDRMCATAQLTQHPPPRPTTG